jgi:hypothetical protein
VPFAYVPPTARHIVLLLSRCLVPQAAVANTAMLVIATIRRAKRLSMRVLRQVR